MQTLAALFSAHGPDLRMVLTHKHRSESVDEALMEAMSAAGLHAHRVEPEASIASTS